MGEHRRGCIGAVAATLLACASVADLPLEGERTVRFETDTVTWLSLDVSPDGDSVVFEAVGDLYVVPIEGGRAERITEGMAFDSQPRFSPDGESIVFVSDRDGGEALWVAGRDGSEPRKLAGGGGDGEFASPAWSPDGSHVVVSKTRWGLGTFELWAYHVDGGKGVRITRAKPSGDTPMDQRANALGAVYSPDGRYLYYARKNGGFGYGLRLPLWQVARRDLREGTEDVLTAAQGSAMRPLLSPDGTRLVYATRHEARTGLRLRDLNTGEDRWLAWPVQRDEQESRFTRDLFPGYAFTPDGRSVLYTREGGIWRVDVASGETVRVPFELGVEQSLGPELMAPYRLGIGPVKARLVRGLAPAPGGGAFAFSALATLYVHDEDTGRHRALLDETTPAFHPAWSPDGRWIAYVTWSSDGGHLWRMRANGRGAPRRLTEHAAFYTDPAWSPDGERIVALRGTSHDRLNREWDQGVPPASDLIWVPANGGEARLVLPARGLRSPHFGPEPDRIYLYASEGPFTRSGRSALTSLRYDGSDRRVHLGVKGPGIYFAEEDVPAEEIRLAPDGRHALVLHANQLYVLRLLNRHLANLQTTVTNASVPLARLTDVGADAVAWSGDGATIHWSVGNHVYSRALASVEFRTREDDAEREEAEEEAAEEADAEEAADDAPTADDGNTTEDGSTGAPATDEGDATAASDNGSDETAPKLREEDDAVASTVIEVYRPRFEPEGALALVGATVLTMEAGETPASVHGTLVENAGRLIEDAVVLIREDRIEEVGPRAAVDVPQDAEVIDVAGLFIVPGYVDTHAHFRVARRVLDLDNWSFLANLAYGVTTALDVQPSTVDVLAYQDLVDAGVLIGPRALSTGPGVFNNIRLKSAEHARAVLRRYRDHYRVRNIKAYIAGNRKQRQWLAQAARELKLMPTTEGALDLKLGLTHLIDGFSGNEHNFPVLDLHRDVVELVARSGLGYTPTLAGRLWRPGRGGSLLYPRVPTRRSEAGPVHAAPIPGGPHAAALLVRRGGARLLPGGGAGGEDSARRRQGGRGIPRPTAGARLPLGALGAGERGVDPGGGAAGGHAAWRGDDRRRRGHRHRHGGQVGGPRHPARRPARRHPAFGRHRVRGQERGGVRGRHLGQGVARTQAAAGALVVGAWPDGRRALAVATDPGRREGESGRAPWPSVGWGVVALPDRACCRLLPVCCLGRNPSLPFSVVHSPVLTSSGTLRAENNTYRRANRKGDEDA